MVFLFFLIIISVKEENYEILLIKEIKLLKKHEQDFSGSVCFLLNTVV